MDSVYNPLLVHFFSIIISLNHILKENKMPITQYLERNAELNGKDCALVELNLEEKDSQRKTWKDYDLTQAESHLPYRREITWKIFNEKANRCAHYLLERGVRRGDKVGILLMNCLEWLPIYFGILKIGALAVPLNFRYASDEIEYCVNLADVSGDTNGKGLYTLSSTIDDAYPIMYYRGNVDNNNVRFANKCWKIVRKI